MSIFNRVIWPCLLVSCAIALTGCEQKGTEEWYMAHPDDLVKMYADCLNTQTFQSDRCIPAVNASNRLIDNAEVQARLQKVKKDYIYKKMNPEKDKNE